MGGNAAAAPASSRSRPKGRNDRAPRRHTPSRSANAGNENRPVAIMFIDSPSRGHGRRSEGRAAASPGGLRGAAIGGAFGLDLIDRIDHGVERQQRGSVPRLVIADWLKHGN